MFKDMYWPHFGPLLHNIAWVTLHKVELHVPTTHFHSMYANTLLQQELLKTNIEIHPKDIPGQGYSITSHKV